tara:strand:- start:1231 stop:1521 length:291 start_codon:yes stop_codon:yes gene_type:complete
MKTLADFKKVIQSCITHQLRMKSTVKDKDGKIIRENSFAPVVHLQSNSFALERNGVKSWAEFHKASAWSFDKGTATRQMLDGTLTFELELPEFLGL